jgi:PBSX family phage portal protein
MMPAIKKKPEDEYDDSWVTTASYIYTTKGLFPISVLKAAEKKEEKAKSTQLKAEQTWLEQNDLVALPFEASTLLKLKDNCGYFDACVKQIAKDVIGQGWRLELREGKKENNQEKERIINFIENSGGDRDETFEQTLERGLIDWGCIGWWGWEISRNKAGKNKDLVNGMWHVPAQTIRVHKDFDKYCQVREDKKVWFKRFGLEGNINLETGKEVGAEGEKRANELIYYRNYYPQSDYYGAPNILSSVGSIMGLIGVRDYNLAFFENYGIPAALIVLKGKWDKASAKKISDFMDVEIKGTDNAHKTMCIHPGRDSTFEHIKLSVDVKEGSFAVYHKSLRDEVLVAYKMPPYRIGITEEGSLGGSTAGESTKIYVASVVTPLEKDIERLVTQKIIFEGLKCENYIFELKELDLRDLDAEAKRDLIYFGLGALTSNQILTRLGKKIYPEGNQYFVSSTYLPIGEDAMEKKATVLEAVKMVIKGKPKLATQIIKIAKQEATK